MTCRARRQRLDPILREMLAWLGLAAFIALAIPAAGAIGWLFAQSYQLL